MTPVLRRIMARRSKAVRARRRSLRHCAPWGGTRHPAMGRRARTRHGRCWAAWAVPVGQDVLPESPRVENRTGGSPAGRGMRRVAAVGPARQGVRSSSAVAPCGLRKAGQGPGRQAQGCAAQGGGRAERNRSWSVLFWSGRFRPVVLVLLSGMSRALRGMWIRAYARLPVMDAAVAIGLAFECVPDPGWLSAVVWAKPCAFAISRRAAGFARRALCFGCALAACLGFSAWIRPCRLPFI